MLSDSRQTPPQLRGARRRHGLHSVSRETKRLIGAPARVTPPAQTRWHETRSYAKLSGCARRRAGASTCKWPRLRHPPTGARVRSAKQSRQRMRAVASRRTVVVATSLELLVGISSVGMSLAENAWQPKHSSSQRGLRGRPQKVPCAAVTNHQGTAAAVPYAAANCSRLSAGMRQQTASCAASGVRWSAREALVLSLLANRVPLTRPRPRLPMY